jgi:F-type H+-transporting ATPase subunit gamma
MLIRQSVARLVVQPSHFGAPPQSARNMATLRELELRLKSVRNIEKITKVGKRFPDVYAHITSCVSP